MLPRVKSPLSPFQGFQGAGSSGDLRLGSEELLEKLGNLISRKSGVTDFNKKSRTQTNGWILGSIFLAFWIQVDLALESGFDQRHFLHHLKGALTSSCLFGTSVGVLPTIAVRTMFQTGGYDGDMSDELAAMRISA